MGALAIIEAAAQILAAVAKLVPQIEQDVAGLSSLSTDSKAELQAKIAQLHTDSQALTAQLDALKGR